MFTEVGSGDSDKVLGEGNSGTAIFVFFLEGGSEGSVVASMVGAEGVHELHSGYMTSGRVVGD